MTFKPASRKMIGLRHINLSVPPELYQRIIDAADKSNVSIREFARQALIYALDEMQEQPR